MPNAYIDAHERVGGAVSALSVAMRATSCRTESLCGQCQNLVEVDSGRALKPVVQLLWLAPLEICLAGGLRYSVYACRLSVCRMTSGD